MKQLQLLKSISLVVALGIPNNVVAADISAEMRTDADSKLRQHLAAEKSGNFEAYLDTLPPAYLAVVADSLGVPLPEFKSAFVELMKHKRGDVALNKMASEIDYEAVVYGLTELERPFAFFPITFRYVTEGIRKDLDGYAIVLMNNNKWYALSVVTEAPAVFLRSAYPDLVGIRFPQIATAGSGSN